MKIEELGIKRGNGKLLSLGDSVVTLSYSIIMVSGVPLWVMVDMHPSIQRLARCIKVWGQFCVCAVAVGYTLCLLHLLSKTIWIVLDKNYMLWTCSICEIQHYYLSSTLEEQQSCLIISNKVRINRWGI